MSVNYAIKKKVYEIIWMGGDLWLAGSILDAALMWVRIKGTIHKILVAHIVYESVASKHKGISSILFKMSSMFAFFVVLNQQIDNFSKAESGPDICCCWKLLHISPILPRVPLLVNTPAVRTKWSSASEMSKLLKGEMSRHEPNLFIGSRSRWRGISRLSLLINEGIPAEFSQSKHAWKLWMTYGGRGNKKKKTCRMSSE